MPPQDPAIAPPPSNDSGWSDLDKYQAGPPAKKPVDKYDNSTRDRFLGFIDDVTGGGNKGIQQKLAEDHQRKLNDIDLYNKNAASLAGALATGIDPATGQQMTPEARAKYQSQHDTMMGHYQKALGNNKEAKGIFQKLQQVSGHLIKSAQAQQAQQSPQNASSSDGGGQPSAGATPAIAPPPASSAAPSASITPPPSSGPISARQTAEGTPALMAQGAQLQKHAQDQADLDAAERRKFDFDPAAMIDGLKKAGFSDEEAKQIAKQIVRNKFSGAAGRPRTHPVKVTDPKDPTKEILAVQDLTPDENGQYLVRDYQGNVIDNPETLLPGMLPSQVSSSSTYNADTGQTTTTRTTQKVAPKSGGKSAIAPPPSRPSSAASPSASASKAGGRLAAMANDWQQNGIVPSAKDRPQVEKWMKDNGQQTPVTLIPAAQKTIEETAPVMDQIDGLLKDIEDLKLGDNNQNGYLTMARAKYAVGIASPEGSLGKDIAGLSLGSVVEAASTLKGASRSVLALKKALEHTPNPWVDSPKLMKEKLTTIKTRLKDVMDDAYKYGKKGTVPNPSGASSSVSPPPDPDAEAAAYLAKHSK